MANPKRFRAPANLEIRLMPHIFAMEERGINLDGPSLKRDIDKYFMMLDGLEERIYDKLRCRVDLDSNEDLADALERAGKATKFKETPKGRRSVAKDSLMGAIDDKEILGHLLVRGAITTCLRTFLQPWYKQYNDYGRLYMQWNQIRNYTDTGARTGRLSSSPNLQNIPVTWEGLKQQLDSKEYKLEDYDLDLPTVRQYIIPDPGKILIGRDYSGQELRLLAHFVKGKLLQALKDEPETDLHASAAKLAGISRREAKTLAFAVIYGAGVQRICESLHTSFGEAQSIKSRYLEALPEIKAFTKLVQAEAAAKIPTKTLNGRWYFPQPAVLVGGRMKSFEYRMVNYKIQGSAAEQTKQAMINYCETTTNGELLLSVHDQLVAQVDYVHAASEWDVLENAMNSSFQEQLDYKVVSDGSAGWNFSRMVLNRNNLLAIDEHLELMYA